MNFQGYTITESVYIVQHCRDGLWQLYAYAMNEQDAQRIVACMNVSAGATKFRAVHEIKMTKVF